MANDMANNIMADNNNKQADMNNKSQCFKLAFKQNCTSIL